VGQTTLNGSFGYMDYFVNTDENGHMFCDYMNNGNTEAGSAQTNVYVPHPVNLVLQSFSKPGNGTLVFNYGWSSSTGNLQDLQHCLVYERLDYQGPNPFTWPSTFCSSQNPNPEYLPSAGINAANGGLMDTQATCFAKPYSATSLPITQTLQYICGTMNGYNNLSGQISLSRTVTQNSNGTFAFTMSAQGQSATVNPMP
jgi:hypothetical protein